VAGLAGWLAVESLSPASINLARDAAQRVLSTLEALRKASWSSRDAWPGEEPFREIAEKFTELVLRLYDDYVDLTAQLNVPGVLDVLSRVNSAAVQVGRGTGASYAQAIQSLAEHELKSVSSATYDFDDTMTVNSAPRKPRAEFLAHAVQKLVLIFEFEAIDRHVFERNRIQIAKEAALACGEIDKAPQEDGPCHPYTWRQNGEVIADRMQPAAWRLVDSLWRRPSRCAAFDELGEHVYQDRDHIFDQTAIGSLRRAANKFFKANGISLRVALKKTLVSLRSDGN
jgi:hypothetical protein